MGLAYPLIEGVTGASPGKWALGLQVGHPDGRRGHVRLYLTRFTVKFIRPVLGALAAWTGVGVLGWMAGPAGLVISLGTLLLLAPALTSVARDKLAVTAVYASVGIALQGRNAPRSGSTRARFKRIDRRPSEASGRPAGRAVRCG